MKPFNYIYTSLFYHDYKTYAYSYNDPQYTMDTMCEDDEKSSICLNGILEIYYINPLMIDEYEMVKYNDELMEIKIWFKDNTNIVIYVNESSIRDFKLKMLLNEIN